jgi:hypothetical protein
METISFNGKTYSGLEEMPADQRAAYEQVMAFMKDENHNGVPDIFEGDAIQKMMGMVSTRIIVNGQEMHGVESLPPEARAKFDKAMTKLSQLGIFPSGTQDSTSQLALKAEAQMAPGEPAFTQSPSFIQSSPAAISEDSGSRTGILIAAIVVLLLCVLILGGVSVFLYLNR